MSCPTASVIRRQTATPLSPPADASSSAREALSSGRHQAGQIERIARSCGFGDEERVRTTSAPSDLAAGLLEAFFDPLADVCGD